MFTIVYFSKYITVCKLADMFGNAFFFSFYLNSTRRSCLRHKSATQRVLARNARTFSSQG